ncbi:NACHT domain-containing protein [Candidatus Albibeggiatoa sp. nov. NOAA]|uniref:NACHT domain-containing protein n=1 Tax=Candidatus Albibeggiatoa sp. nov. NOAA TaxID=3162724 RepID=UPI0032FE54AE|nr:NACHT domain-containing protein [Thiotrichaceae bacterium]
MSKRKSKKQKNTVVNIHGDVNHANISAGDGNKSFIQPPQPIDSDSDERKILSNLQEYIEQNISGYVEPELNHSLWVKVLKEKQNKLVRTNGDAKQFPQDMEIIDIFKEVGNILLILGDAGTGKTMTLHKLASELLDDVKKNTDSPTPIMLNLSSWAKERKPIKEWLIDRITSDYYLKKYRGNVKKLLEKNHILPLLDGLDEVQKKYRRDCVSAINEFAKEECGLSGLVVCSRSEEYNALRRNNHVRRKSNQSNWLEFRSAIVLKKLTDEQINDYLQQKESFKSLQILIQLDTDLHKLAETPLFLNVMSVVYEGLPLDEVNNIVETMQNMTLHVKQEELFESYTEKVFHLKCEKKEVCPYTKYCFINSLSWLAYQMKEHDTNTFYIERLDLTWLSEKQKKIYFQSASIRLALIFGMLLGISGILPPFGAGTLYLVGVFWGAVLGAFTTPKLKEKLITGWDFCSVYKNANSNIAEGLVLGLIMGFLGWGTVSLFSVIHYPHYYLGFTELVEYSLLTTFFSGLLFTLSGGFKYKPLQLREQANPNRGVLLVAKNGAQISSLLTLFVILGYIIYIATVSVVNPTHTTIENNISSYLLVSLVIIFYMTWIFCLIFLFNGGISIIKHYTVRNTLSSDSLPFKLVDFFDHCTKLILLRRVGGGYMFLHRLLLDHFAQKYREKLE